MSYATDAEFCRMSGVSRNVVQQYTKDDRDAFVKTASDIADGYMGAQHVTPLTTPLPANRTDLKLVVCHIAGYLLLSDYGFNPESPGDPIVVQNYDRALVWLEKVSKGEIALGQVDSTSDLVEGAPTVSSYKLRGW